MAKLADSYVSIKARNETKRGLDEVKSHVSRTTKEISSNFGNVTASLTKMGGAVGLAFGGAAIANFLKDSIHVAAKIEGVRAAFLRLNDATLLNRLRTATRGTVADLNLMQIAVRANNFQIPLQQLASLLEFAQRRARATGEDVNYLVDSIIMGIGRKSIMILDNLGISSTRLRDKLKGVGLESSSIGDVAKAVGDVATEEMAKMGAAVDTTADKISRLSVWWENLKVIIGGVSVDALTSMGRLLENTYGWLKKIGELPIRAFAVFGVDISDEGLGLTTKEKQDENIPPVGSMERLAYDIREKNKGAAKEVKQEWSESGKSVGEITKRIEELQNAQSDLIVGSSKLADNQREIARLAKLINYEEEKRLKYNPFKMFNEQKKELEEIKKLLESQNLSTAQKNILLERQESLQKEIFKYEHPETLGDISGVKAKGLDNKFVLNNEVESPKKPITDFSEELDRSRQSAEEWSGTLSNAFIDIATGSSTAIDALKRIGTELAFLIIKGLIFKAIWSAINGGAGGISSGYTASDFSSGVPIFSMQSSAGNTPEMAKQQFSFNDSNIVNAINSLNKSGGNQSSPSSFSVMWNNKEIGRLVAKQTYIDSKGNFNNVR